VEEHIIPEQRIASLDLTLAETLQDGGQPIRAFYILGKTR
jgi:hypothetical protein